MRRSILRDLSDYLESDSPNGSGEIGMYCPLHDDNRRSASLNVKTGMWFCHACEKGGQASELVSMLPAVARDSGRQKKVGEKPLPNEAQIAGWSSALRGNQDILDYLRNERGFTKATIARFGIGWDRDNGAITIPVRDQQGVLVNVRRYVPDQTDDRRKIWSVAGHGEPVLYPAETIPEWGKVVVICEGEWDTLLTIQHGFPAVTRTGAADVWKPEWNRVFKDKIVYICHDMDSKGQRANIKVLQQVSKLAKEVKIVSLPYPLDDKHGKDLTDFWLEHNKQDFIRLVKKARGADIAAPEPELSPPTMEPTPVSVLESFETRRAGDPIRLRVTICGKARKGQYLVPREVTYSCSQEAGAKCTVCPMSTDFDGHHVEYIEPDDIVVQRIVDANEAGLTQILRDRIKAQKCTLLEIEEGEKYGVEVPIIRESVEHGSVHRKAGDYVTRSAIAIHPEWIKPNSTVEMIGAVVPSPKDRVSQFQAWYIENTQTDIDNYEFSAELRKLMQDFQSRPGQSPLAKLKEINEDIARHVTHIRGRARMHAFMDLTFHSVLAFEFAGRLEEKGWLDTLIIGDTRTGKSEAAERLIRHYNAGELVSCESASYAGVVGGLEQFGGKEWNLKWGAIPLNDRRIVVLDEVSGLTPDQIAQMSSIRSSGVAQITKIQSEQTLARTRLLWLANPREGRIANHIYGVNAIAPLIGKNEDIARFDMAMCVASHEVDPEEINRIDRPKPGEQRYGAEACQALLRWVWSRRPEQIVWQAGVEKDISNAATELGRRYIEEPPLVQSANARFKVARIAAALAARTFSTDRTYQKVVVTKAHVKGAVQFLDSIYGSRLFGYGKISSKFFSRQAKLEDNLSDAKHYILTTGGLLDFLQNNPKFRAQDLRDILNVSLDDASGMISHMSGMGMLDRSGADFMVTPEISQQVGDIDE